MLERFPVKFRDRELGAIRRMAERDGITVAEHIRRAVAVYLSNSQRTRSASRHRATSDRAARPSPSRHTAGHASRRCAARRDRLVETASLCPLTLALLQLGHEPVELLRRVVDGLEQVVGRRLNDPRDDDAAAAALGLTPDDLLGLVVGVGDLVRFYSLFASFMQTATQFLVKGLTKYTPGVLFPICVKR
jgi:hypothetical protein